MRKDFETKMKNFKGVTSKTIYFFLVLEIALTNALARDFSAEFGMRRNIHSLDVSGSSSEYEDVTLNPDAVEDPDTKDIARVSLCRTCDESTQCAENLHEQACDGTVRDILPPTSSVYDVIQSNPNYSILREVLQNAGLEETLKSSSPITFLAPLNLAFTMLRDDELETLKTDKHLANVILRKHILPVRICCAAVGKDLTRLNEWEVSSLVGITVGFSRDVFDFVHAGTATVLNCDMMATNGIIHSVTRVMMLRSEFVNSDRYCK